jgi:hypothetical protein
MINKIKINFEAIQPPLIKEVRGKDYIFYGEDNLYPQKLIELYNSSAMHHTAVDAIKTGIIGLGIETIGENIVNADGETLNEIYEKISLDYTLFNGFSLNVIWNKEGTKIVEAYHLPFNNVRTGKLNEEEKVNEYYYSSNWCDVRKYKPKEYKAFNPTDNKGDNASQVYYCYVYSPGNDYYPLPEYVGALNDIDLDCRISKFHNSNISNGLAPSMFIKFRNGVPTPEAREEIYREIETTFSGEENAGRFFLSFSDPGAEMQVEPIENANDEYYITLDARVSSRILTAHKITSPLIIGIRDNSNGFSSNADEIEVAYGHFVGTVIVPKRKKIMNNLVYLLKFMGFNINLIVKPNEIIISKTIAE